MKKYLPFIMFLALFMFYPNQLFANEKGGVGPFGLDIGKDSFEILRDGLDKKGCSYNDISAITKGPLVFCPSQNFDFNGLENDVIIIFDEENVLAAVQMVIDKFQYNSVRSSLASKYHVVSEQRPFVGNRSTYFKSHNVNISLDAPHLSGQMTLLYSTDQFDRQYNQHQQNKEKARKQKQASQL